MVLHPRGGVRAFIPFALLLAASALSGCAISDGDGSIRDPWSAAPDLDWAVLDANTTASEPWEQQGDLFIGWSQGAFAIHASDESDLPRYLVRTNDTVYTSYSRMGWIATPVAVAIGPETTMSNRMLLWDLRGLLGSPDLERDKRDDKGNVVYTAKGALEHRGRPLPVDTRVTVDGDRIVHATVASSEGRESPFTFLSPESGLKVPDFPKVAPAAARVLDQATVDTKDAVAQEYHARLIKLIQAYQQNHGGILPERVTAEELRAEMIVEGGGPWPTGAYDGAPVADQDKSGHFAWSRCTLQNGHFVGHGWDGGVLDQAFGAGCG